ncbi:MULTISPECIES: hypothetical protein [unclassified Campylobacter]|uniref:hypothetical protein n=1 Tax=unclassified Campylobacter TaxID=2593542 RepID=UPI0014510BB9|nr:MULTISPECIES: hypothetical protein [unclassified Campylobacter]QCD52867.1 hypothetical protein CDOMC_1260 [Campylobacter sp. RM16192]
MDRLTQKERAALEDVFTAIYADRESKISSFYRVFYKKIILNTKNFTSKINYKVFKFKNISLKRK